ncbi:hypothetical protein HDU85_005645 [Gaertneriomyces sp. JEL0708]|nr:hypothetical protein HDU85_005645 [Gaertneriomyces sp. JEL0708]
MGSVHLEEETGRFGGDLVTTVYTAFLAALLLVNVLYLVIERELCRPIPVATTRATTNSMKDGGMKSGANELIQQESASDGEEPLREQSRQELSNQVEDEKRELSAGLAQLDSTDGDMLSRRVVVEGIATPPPTPPRTRSF